MKNESDSFLVGKSLGPPLTSLGTNSTSSPSSSSRKNKNLSLLNDSSLSPFPKNKMSFIPKILADETGDGKLVDQSRLRANPAPKRDRPLSSYFDSPAKELDEYFKYADINGDTNDYLDSDSPYASKNSNQFQQNDNLMVKNEFPNSSSPLTNRKPFKNLSNFVNNFEFPMKMKFSSKSKNLTKSMSLVSKHSQNDSDNKDLNRSNNFLNRYRSHHQRQGSLEDTDVDDDEDDDDDEDGNNTTLNDEDHLMNDLSNSPTQPTRNSTAYTDKSIRRIHSMYQTNKEKESYNDMMMEDNSHLSNTSIKTFKVDNDLLPRIDEDEMFKIVNGEYNHEFDEFIIIDCRFNYEFEGGHINGSLNISSQKDLEQKFITSKLNSTNSINNDKKKLLIFHCEFSIFRGPTMASHLRKCDRILNSDHYPFLSYPDIVVLEGGYKNFFDKYKANCYPQSYIEMKNINYQKTCELEMGKVRQETKLTRAKSQNHFPNISTSMISSKPSNNRPFAHNRSNSYTTVTSHAENLKILKRHRSSTKVQNRHSNTINDNRASRSSTVSTPSIFNSCTSPDSKNFEMSSSSCFFDDDFQPPSALFRSTSSLNSKEPNHRPSLSNSTNINSASTFSINSSASSFSSDQYSAFSSSDSLADSYSSPMIEFPELFESNLSNKKASSLSSNLNRNSSNSVSPFPSMAAKSSSTSLLNPMMRKPSAPVPQAPHLRKNSSFNGHNNNVPITSPFNDISSVKQNTQINHNSNNMPNSGFKFPNNSSNPSNNINNNPSLKSKASRHSLKRINTKPSTALLTDSSPIISSPLSTVTPKSTIDSAISNNTLSLIDPINDTPVDFSVPFSTSNTGGGSLSSLYGGNYGLAKSLGRHINHGHKRSQGGLYSFVSLDIDEVEEEVENDQ